MRILALFLSFAVGASGQTTLFEDNFNSGMLSPQWTVSSVGSGNATVTAGRLEFLGLIGSQVFAHAGSPMWTNYELELWANVQPGFVFLPNPIFVIRFRQDPVAGTFAAIEIDFAGAVIRLVNEGGTVFYSQALPVNYAAWHRYQVQVQGTSVALVIDGTLFFTRNEPSLLGASHPAGCITIGNKAGGSSVDDVKVTTPPLGSMTLTFSQPQGSGSLSVQNGNGIPGAFYFTAVSLEPINATSPGTGPWSGLYISLHDLAVEVLWGAPPFVGVLDATGGSVWSLPANSVPPAFPTLHAVTRTYDLAQLTITGVSNLVSHQVQTGPPGPPPSFAYALLTKNFSAGHRHTVAKDFTNDGFADLANWSAIWRGNGLGGFVATQVDPIGIEMDIAELTGDAHMDLLIYDDTNGGVYVYRGDSQGHFTMPLGPIPIYVEDGGDAKVVDIDNDGDSDLIISAGATSSGGAHIYVNNGSGGFFQNATFWNASETCEAADLNGDNKPELILSKILSGPGFAGAQTIILWGNFAPGYNENLSSQLTVMPQNRSRWIRAYDMDNDGDQDLLWVGVTSQGILLNNGGPVGSTTPSFTYSPISIAPIPGVLPMMTAADVDKDGDLDVLFLADDGGQRWLVIGVNNGSGQIQSYWYVGPVSADAEHVYPCDIDNDGDDDLIIGGSMVRILMNQN